MWIRVFVCCALVLSLSASALAWSGKVVGVSDGDTIKVLNSTMEQVKIRLYGVDTPEKKQEFGQVAKQFTSDMVFGKMVDVEVLATDRYGRKVALVYVDNLTLNEELVRAGQAWVYDRYCDAPMCLKWKGLQAAAKKERLGLWADQAPTPPWEWRKGAMNAVSSSSQPLPQETLQKPSEATSGFNGNVKSKAFHSSNCKNFNCANCTAHFDTRQEAISAGYHPCGLCKP